MLEVDIKILVQVNDRARVVVTGLAALEHLDGLDRTWNVEILRGNLNDDLHVLADTVKASHEGKLSTV